MARAAVILCGGAKLPRGGAWRAPDPVRVNFSGPNRTATLRIEDISNKMLDDLPPVVTDLVEIAAYVLGADQSVGRGGRREFEFGTTWRRHFRLAVPVRCPDVWTAPAVKAQLEATLGFLSDDVYQFEFSGTDRAGSLAQYLFSGSQPGAPNGVEAVTLFSGGVDSFAGAVRETLTDRRRVALVSHRSVSKVDSRQQALVASLRDRAGAQQVPLHVPVWMHRHGDSLEYSQRSRSFLFIALGTAVARMCGLAALNIYENGIVSLNLPICEQVVGGRATRTTHPKVIHGLSRLLSLVLEMEFRLETPFADQTKTEVVQGLAASGQADLIRHTSSCTRTKDATKLHTHCGRCSQCIDRRFAMLAAGCGAQDPAEMYAVDLLTGARETPDDRTMIERWVGMANEIEAMDSEIALFTKYPNANDAIGYMDGGADAAAKRVFALHKRHAAAVGGVVTRAISDHAEAIRKGSLAPTCLLRTVGSIAPGPARAAELKPIPDPISNAELAERAGLLEADKMSRDIRDALGISGTAMKQGAPGKPRIWTRLQLDRATPHLPEGKLRAYLEASGLGKPEGT